MLKANRILPKIVELEKFGKYAEAISLCQEFVKQNPGNRKAIKKLEKLYAANGNSSYSGQKKALAYLIKLYTENRNSEFAAFCAKHHSQLSVFSEYFNVLGLFERRMGQPLKSIETFKKGLIISPNSSDLLTNLGLAYRSLSSYKHAVAVLEKAVQIDPRNQHAFNNLGICFKELKLHSRAIKAFEQAMELDPNLIAAHCNLGVVKYEIGQREQAVTHYKDALDINPQYGDAHYNLGCYFQDLQDFDQAETSFHAAIEKPPFHFDAAVSIAVTMRSRGDMIGAINWLDNLLCVKPDFPEAIWNKALCYLASGDFTSGWPLHEYRWRINNFESMPLETSLPEWDGTDRVRLLLWAEQGIGDEIMFSSAFEEIAAKCQSVTVQTNARLKPLFERAFRGRVNFICDKSQIRDGDYDAHLPIGSVFRFTRPTSSSFAAQASGYLTYDGTRATELRKGLLNNPSDKLIGLSWFSKNPRSGVARSCKLEDMLEALPDQGCSFVNLQYGDVENDIRQAENVTGKRVSISQDLEVMNDLDGLASLIGACDAVISVDNTTVHMAGALGKKTHVLLPFAAEWRWGNEETKTHLYESLTLHRQTTPKCWKNPLQKIQNTF